MSYEIGGYRLALGYKGQRTYLQGGDIFNAINTWASSAYGPTAFISRLSFRQIARTACVVTTQAPAGSNVGNGQVMVSGVEVPFWLVETVEPIQDRYPYDEEAVVAALQVDVQAREAVLPVVTATPIEEVIAVTKRLNNEVAPLTNGKWLFGQLHLEQPLTRDGRSLRIAMRSLLANRFSVNDIYYDDELIGNIRFVVGQP